MQKIISTFIPILLCAFVIQMFTYQCQQYVNKPNEHDLKMLLLVDHELQENVI